MNTTDVTSSIRRTYILTQLPPRCMNSVTMFIAMNGEVRGSSRQVRGSQAPMPRGVGPICRPPTGQVPKPTLPASLLNSPRDSQRVQSRDRLNRAVVGTGHRTGVRNNTRGRDRVLQRILGHTSRKKNTLRNLHIRRSNLHLRGIRRYALHG